jgi:hypothetical protein
MIAQVTVRPIAVLFAAALVACAAGTEADGQSADAIEAARHHPHPPPPVDAGPPATTDAGSSGSSGGPTDPGDGTPTRLTCTGNFGSGLSSGSHGRLDGTLVSIVPPASGQGCNGDAHHLHLQIAMNGGTYDIAVNIAGVDVLERDGAMVGGPWTEGWNSNEPLDFPTSFGVHSSDFSSIDEQTLAQHLESLLADVNHISVFATKYSTGGAHLIHRNGNGNDGALVLQPLSGAPHYVLVHFPNQTF